ncbi:MAG: hypothetical protein GY820_21180 [Gammaproteobacteria bacterium]|nr:hypothetical protein [Gammaproteobacteria bacterium]
MGKLSEYADYTSTVAKMEVAKDEYTIAAIKAESAYVDYAAATNSAYAEICYTNAKNAYAVAVKAKAKAETAYANTNYKLNRKEINKLFIKYFS